MLYELIETSIESGFRSDHSLINIYFFKKEISERGPSYWRFNANLLNDKEYIDYIKEKIASFKTKYDNLGYCKAYVTQLCSKTVIRAECVWQKFIYKNPGVRNSFDDVTNL
jgi:hypothetical protein